MCLKTVGVNVSKLDYISSVHTIVSSIRVQHIFSSYFFPLSYFCHIFYHIFHFSLTLQISPWMWVELDLLFSDTLQFHPHPKRLKLERDT